MKDESQVRIVRGFALRMDGHPTVVLLDERSDGAIQMSLITEREGQEPLVSRLGFVPKTMALVQQALFLAAHDPGVWRLREEDEAKP